MIIDDSYGRGCMTVGVRYRRAENFGRSGIIASLGRWWLAVGTIMDPCIIRLLIEQRVPSERRSRTIGKSDDAPDAPLSKVIRTCLARSGIALKALVFSRS